MTWVLWLPHMVVALLFVLLVVNTNLPRPIEFDRSPVFLAALYFAGATF